MVNPPAEAAADDDLDLDLDFGDDGEDAPALDAPVAATDEAAPDSDALDLTELEKMLDVEDTTDSPALRRPRMDSAWDRLSAVYTPLMRLSRDQGAFTFALSGTSSPDS